MSEPQDPQSPPGQGGTRRRRRRAGARNGDQPAASSAAAADAGPRPAPPPQQAAGGGRGGKRRARRAGSGAAKRDPAEQSLREIVGAGPSQLSVSAALRARDVNRPTEEDLAEAERDVVLVRRHWRPPPQRGN